MASPLKLAARAGANLSRAARHGLSRGTIPRRGGAWVVVRVGPSLEELATPHLPFTHDESLPLLDVLATLAAAADDPGVDGVLLRLSGSPGGFGKLSSLRRAVQRVTAAGKPVAVWAESLDAEGMLLASAATRIWLPESGTVWLVGLRADAFFFRGLLDRLGARADVVSVGRFKSAGDRFARERMSPEDREQLEALVDDLFEQLVEAVAEGRDLAPQAVRELVDRGPYAAPEAVEAGLADACLYPDEIEAALAQIGLGDGDAESVRLVEGSAYHALRASDPGWRPLLSALPRIAYVVARGGIHRGSGPRGIASDTLRRLLERLRRDDEVRGVVLRLDTPGGDGTASDLLWRAVSQLRKEKPVVVSMGDVVASGGYYVAAAADAVLAERATLTGSIGVVGGKVDLGEAYRRLGVHKESVQRGARAGLLDESRSFTSDERAALRRGLAHVYDLFLDRVARGRSLSGEALARAAGGRVWSGARALELGLVDALGGPLEALREVRGRAGLRDGERAIVDVHPRLPGLLGLRALARFLPRRIVVP